MERPQCHLHGNMDCYLPSGWIVISSWLDTSFPSFFHDLIPLLSFFHNWMFGFFREMDLLISLFTVCSPTSKHIMFEAQFVAILIVWIVISFDWKCKNSWAAWCLASIWLYFVIISMSSTSLSANFLGVQMS